MTEGKCRTCGQRILWINTKAGKPLQMDPDPVRFRIMSRFGPDMGPEKFMTTDGLVVRRGIRDENGDGYGYVSHLVTCPGKRVK